MPKCIKSITAGLLHLEIIGTTPGADGKKSRCPRRGPTSPGQQFYNLKCSWRELELALAANFAARDWVLVFTYDDSHLPENKKTADGCLQKFIRRYRTVRRRRGEELRYIYATEGFHERRRYDHFVQDGALEDRRLHHHMVLNFTSPDDLEEIRSLWQGGGYVRAEPLDVHYYRELAKYMTKEAREFGRPKPGERTWRGSRNLKKYQVEYIEIPSDSVTLAPPAGAVDYENFHEKNPYGFADCVGARYLLFPEHEPGHYTYNSGRRRERLNNFSA